MSDEELTAKMLDAYDNQGGVDNEDVTAAEAMAAALGAAKAEFAGRLRALAFTAGANGAMLSWAADVLETWNGSPRETGP